MDERNTGVRESELAALRNREREHRKERWQWLLKQARRVVGWLMLATVVISAGSEIVRQVAVAYQR